MSADDKAAAAWDDYVSQQQEEKIEELERQLNAANDRIKRLEEVTQERDKEWFQVIESILGFHPVSMTEALRIGIERIKKTEAAHQAAGAGGGCDGYLCRTWRHSASIYWSRKRMAQSQGGQAVSREQLPYMSDEQFNRVAFIYRSKTDGIRVVGLLEAKNYEDKTKYQHLATLDSFRWIECLLRNTAKERNKQIKEILK